MIGYIARSRMRIVNRFPKLSADIFSALLAFKKVPGVLPVGPEMWRGGLAYRHTYYIAAIFSLLSWIIIALCALYTTATIFGFLAGYPLPTSTIFRSPIFGKRLSELEPYAPLGLLSLAAAGGLTSWLGVVGLLNQRIVRAAEVRLCHLWSISGLPVSICVGFFSLSAGGWSGIFRAGDVNYFSILDMLPHSDPFGYVEAFYVNAATGHWTLFGARRPLAQAIRDLLQLVASHSYVITLSIQAVLVATFTYIAAASVVRWRGIWSGFAFAALAWLLARPFVATTTTEPLAIVLTLASLPFLLEAYGKRSLSHILVALLALSMALFVRMGNLFLIPFAVVVLPFGFGAPARRPVHILMLGTSVAGLALLESAALSALYSPHGAAIGGNFVWTLCGLASGTNWGICWDKFASEASALYPDDDRAVALFVLAKSFHIFLAKPFVLLQSFYRNAYDFFRGLLPFFLGGYTMNTYRPPPLLAFLLTVLLLPGIAFSFVRGMKSAERWFWMGIFVTTILAAALVLSDDGWRVLTVTNVLIAYLLALGFYSPSVVTTARYAPRLSPSWKVGGIALGALLAMLLIVPEVSHFLMTAERSRLPPAPVTTSEHATIFGGRYLMGFVVVSEDDQRTFTSPTIRFNQFAKLFTNVGLFDNPLALIAAARTRVPFAFVCSPASLALGTASGNYYITPPEVLDWSQVKIWHLTLAPSAIPPSSDIRIIEATKAEPQAE